MNDKKRLPAGVEPLWSRYIHAKGSALGLPLAGNFELTTRCNFNCKMCYVHCNKNRSELSAKEWIDIGKTAAKNGMVFLLLTGGEPLIRPDFKVIYKGLKEQGLLLSINTNASLIDDDMLDFFVKDPPLRMNISLYGASNETYSRLCGIPAYDKVSKNIIDLHAAGIQIRINASITPYNACDIEELYKFADNVGVPLKGTTYMFPPIRVNGSCFGDAPHRFTPEEAAQYMLQCREQYMTPEQLKNSAIDASREDSECYDGQGDRMHCRAGKTAFWVTWDGRMLPCGMFSDEGYKISEVGFENAWTAVRERCSELRMPAKCSSCVYKERCAVCAASCLSECGSTSSCPEYVCRMTETLEKLTIEKYGRSNIQNESK